MLLFQCYAEQFLILRCGIQREKNYLYYLFARKRIDMLLSKADGTLAAEPFLLPDDTSSSNGDDTITT